MEAYIVAGSRTAVGKAKRGGFRFTNPVDLGYYTIKDLLARVPNLDPKAVDDLIVGNAVPEAEQGLQMARWVAVRSLPLEVPGVTVNRPGLSIAERKMRKLGAASTQSGGGREDEAGGREAVSGVVETRYPKLTVRIS